MVSIVISTMNSALLLPQCLDSITRQTWSAIETIVVDGFSTDNTIEVARRYGAKVFCYGPRQSEPYQRFFGTPYQWNYGAKLATGNYLYLVDSDMRLAPRVVEDCVNLAQRQRYDAVIVPEVSYGEGFWAECKSLQRSFFLGDSSIESPRFIRMGVWRLLNGVDSSLRGYLDWDLTDRLKEREFKIGRTRSVVYHYEGRLQLLRLIRKKYIHGRATSLYFSKHRKTLLTAENFSRFSIIRPAYIDNFRKLLANPKLAVGFLVMIISEYIAATFGAIKGITANRHNVEIQSEP